MDGWLDKELIEEKDRVEIDKELRSLWVLWVGNVGVLFAVVFICYVFGERIRENMNVRSDFPIGIFRTVLLVVGILSLVLAYFLRGHFLSERFKGFEKAYSKSGAYMNKPSYLLKYRSGIFLPTAISGSIAIYGFLLFILGDGFYTLWVVIIISAVGLLYHRPKREEIIELLGREKKESQIERS